MCDKKLSVLGPARCNPSLGIKNIVRQTLTYRLRQPEVLYKEG